MNKYFTLAAFILLIVISFYNAHMRSNLLLLNEANKVFLDAVQGGIISSEEAKMLSDMMEYRLSEQKCKN